MVVIRNSLGEVFQDSEEQMLKTYILRLFPKGIVTLSSQWKYFVTFGTIILISPCYPGTSNLIGGRDI